LIDELEMEFAARLISPFPRGEVLGHDARGVILAQHMP
jgi:hypothetical protein